MKLAKERTCKGIDSLGLAIFSGTSSDRSQTLLKGELYLLLKHLKVVVNKAATKPRSS